MFSFLTWRSVVLRWSSIWNRLLVVAGRPWIWLGPLFLVALGARIWGLQASSLDFDESWSLYLARLPLATLWGKFFGQGPDPHPPLYFLLLRMWLFFFGSSEVALRSLSVLGGAILVVLLFLWSSAFTSWRTGLLMALLAALSPYLIWYSQEARMYIWVATFGLGSTLALERALGSGRWAWWAIYFLLGLATLYTHLVGGALLLVHLLLLLLVGDRVKRQRRSMGMLWLGLLGLAYLPYAYPTWMQGISVPAAEIYPNRDFLSAVGDFLLATTVHSAPLSTTGQALVLGFVGLLALAGWWSMGQQGAGRMFAGRAPMGWGQNREGIRKAIYIALFLVLPIVMILFLSQFRALYHPKFLILSAPPLLLLWGEGVRAVVHRLRPLGVLIGALLLGLNLYGWAYNGTGSTQREDWRTAGNYLTEQTGPGDAILVHLEHYWFPLAYYYPGPASITHPFGSRIPNLESVAEILPDYERYAAVWLVLSGEHLGDPHGIVEGWFRSRYPLITEVFPARIRIQGYATQYRFSELPPGAQPLEARVGESLNLRGYLIDQKHFPASSQVLHPPSRWVHIVLFWEQMAGPEPVEVRVEMVDSWGQVWGGNLPQASGLRAVYPPERWGREEILRDDYDVNLNPVTPAGEYRIILRASHPLSGEPLALEQNGEPVSALFLTAVEVVD